VDLGHERRRLLVVWLVVAVAPLSVVPGGFTRFVLAKLLVVAVALCVGAFLRPQGRLPLPLVVTLVCGALVTAAAAVAGDTPVASLVGRWPRYEGLPVLGLYAAALWLGARTVGRGIARTVHVAHALGGMSLLLCAVSVLEVLGSSPLGPSDADRPGSLLGNATDQGVVAAMAALAIAGTLVRYQDSFLLLSLGAALSTVALSGSRTAIVVTAVGLVVVHVRSRDRRLGPPLVGAAGLVVLALAVPSTRHRLPDLATAEARLTQWRLTLDLVADHPWLGVGPSRYVDAFGRYEDAEWVRFTGAATLADSPHNVLLQAAVAGGIPLVGVLVGLVVVVTRAARAAASEHPESWLLLAPVAAYAVSLLGGFTAAGPTCLAAFLLGAAVAAPAPDRESRWQRLPAAAVGLAATVAMAAGCLADIRLADGIDQAASGTSADAMASLDAARSYQPLDGDIPMLGAQAMAARAAVDARAVDPASELARESLDHTPGSYASLLALGVARRAGDDAEGSLDALDRLVELFPFRAEAYHQRSLTRRLLGDDDGARADADRARELRR
jgi:O-antigen ligase